MISLIILSLNILTINTTAEGRNSHQSTYTAPTDSLPNDNIATDQEETCLVPCDEIIRGAPGPDAIPSVDNPVYYSVEDANADLVTTDVIMGVEIEGQMYGFPHNILDWHEIVNHRVGDLVLSITYCPLTGTGIPYTQDSELGTSGSLYENNLVYYDRNTNSYWSQMFGQAITGDRIGDTHEQGKMVEMTWGAFSLMYPDAQVLSRDTGYNRNYDRYPYSSHSYRTSDSILFPSSYDDSRAPYNLYGTKDLTVVLKVDNKWALIPFAELGGEKALAIDHEGQPLTFLFHEETRYAFPVVNDFNGEQLVLTKISTLGYDVADHFSMALYEDQFGNVWNMKGEAIAGPDVGAVLEQYPGYNAYWFAATSFFGNGTLYQADQTVDLTEDVPFGDQYTESESAPFTGYTLVGLAIIPILIKLRRD